MAGPLMQGLTWPPWPSCPRRPRGRWRALYRQGAHARHRPGARPGSDAVAPHVLRSGWSGLRRRWQRRADGGRAQPPLRHSPARREQRRKAGRVHGHRTQAWRSWGAGPAPRLVPTPGPKRQVSGARDSQKPSGSRSPWGTGSCLAHGPPQNLLEAGTRGVLEAAWLTGRLRTFWKQEPVGCRKLPGSRAASEALAGSVVNWDTRCVSPTAARRLPGADRASEPLSTEKTGRRLAQGPRAPRLSWKPTEASGM